MDEHEEETVALVSAPSDGADEFADSDDNEDVLIIEKDRASAATVAPSPSS